MDAYTESPWYCYHELTRRLSLALYIHIHVYVYSIVHNIHNHVYVVYSMQDGRLHRGVYVRTGSQVYARVDTPSARARARARVCVSACVCDRESVYVGRRRW